MAFMATALVWAGSEPASPQTCMSESELYNISGGQLYDEYVWKGTHYSDTCYCPMDMNPSCEAAVTSGISSAHACAIGSACECGVCNSQPWVGVIVHAENRSIIELGDTPKPFVRGTSFFWFDTELAMLQAAFTCSKTMNNKADFYDFRFECTVNDNLILTLRGQGEQRVMGVEIYWKGDLPDDISQKFVDLYGFGAAETLLHELHRDTPLPGQRQKSVAFANHVIEHYYFREAIDTPAEHWVSVK